MARVRFSPKSLQAKLALLVVGISTCVLFVFSIGDVVTTRNDKFAELEEYTETLAERSAGLLLRPVWNVDLPSIAEIMRSLMEDRRVHALAVLEEDGSTILYGVLRGGSRLRSLPDLSAGIFSYRHDLIERDQYIGSVAVYVTPKYVHQELWQQVFTTTLRTIAVVGALGLLILILMRKVVLRPLKQLSKTAEEITTQKTYSLRAEKEREDEIGSIIDSFNGMLAQIEERDHMLNSRRKHLETLVQERTYELMESRSRAERASKVKSEFVANMSHEIRTPMNSIIGMVEIAQRTELTPKQKEYLHILRSSARSLLGIVNDILDFSKIEANKLELETLGFSLRTLVEEVTDLFGDRVAQKGVELIADICGDVPDSLEGDPFRIKQVLVNLVTNAFKFTDHGEILIRISVEKASSDDVTLLFSVSDTGIGINPELRDRLFDSFVQADEGVSRQYGGSGLGLAIAKELVNLMGGRISVRSEPGRGSDFRFMATFTYGNTVSERAYNFPAELSGMRVLLVEDNESNLRVLEKMLLSFGFVCDAFSNGEEAYDILRRKGRKSYGLVLLDGFMPGLDGVELVKRMRHLGETLPPVILLTAYGKESEQEQAESLGISSFLMKPVKAVALYNAIMQTFGYEVVAEKGEDIVEHMEFDGVRVLLVEDNVINQQVAQEVLEADGLVVEVAENGLKALELLRQRSFDVVFMDIQMPTLDGVEATKRIRKNPEWASLPVIAMTAHVMSEDRELAMQAGMNDYLTKPIERSILFSVLRKWVGKDVRPVKLPPSLFVAPEDVPENAMSLSDRSYHSPVSEAIMSNEMSVMPHNSQQGKLPESLPGVDVDEALSRVSGKVWLLGKILKGFLSAYCGSVEEFRMLAEENAYEELERKAHTVAGAAGNVSAISVRECSLAVERCARNKGDGLSEMMQDLDNAMQEACSSMAQLIKLLDEVEGASEQ